MASDKLPTIAMLWIGGSLRWLEQLCIQSFLDHGHEVLLYCYDKVENVPAGVTIEDANDIYPSEQFIRHSRSGSPAIHADVFRLHLMKKTDYIWSDTDAYCLRPWRLPDSGHFHARVQSDLPLIANGVLRLPKDSPTLDAMMEFMEDEYPIPDWFSDKQKKMLLERKARGDALHISELPWGTSGPNLLTHCLKVTREYDKTLPHTALYPLPYAQTHWFFRAVRKHQKARIEALLKEDTVSIHFYGRRFSDISRNFDGVPEPNSFLGELLKKHDIDWRATSCRLAGHHVNFHKVILPEPGIDVSWVTDADCARFALREPMLPEKVGLDWRKRRFESAFAFARERRDVIVYRALEKARKKAESFVEDLDECAPKSIASLGSCGGFVELFLYRRYACRITLIDDADLTVDAEERAFSPERAKAFLVANGVPASSIVIADLESLEKPGGTKFDVLIVLRQPGRRLAPLTTFAPLFSEAVKDGGSIIADLRIGAGGYPCMQRLGPTRTLANEGKVATIMTRVTAQEMSLKNDATL